MTPTLLDRLPEGYLEASPASPAVPGATRVMGAFRRDAEERIYNAAISLGSAPVQRYAKQHLVPFGEYSPPLFGWFYQLAQILMSTRPAARPTVRRCASAISRSRSTSATRTSSAPS